MRGIDGDDPFVHMGPQREPKHRVMPALGFRTWKVELKYPEKRRHLVLGTETLSIAFHTKPGSKVNELLVRDVSGILPEYSLQSLNRSHGDMWSSDDPVKIAECISHNHPAPHQHCECGLYAISQIEGLQSWNGHFAYPCDDCVTGVVAGYGDRVEQHGEHGFRAHKMRILGFIDRSRPIPPAIQFQHPVGAYHVRGNPIPDSLIRTTDTLAFAVGEKMGLPVMDYKTMMAMVSEVAEPLPKPIVCKTCRHPLNSHVATGTDVVTGKVASIYSGCHDCGCLSWIPE